MVCQGAIAASRCRLLQYVEGGGVQSGNTKHGKDKIKKK